MSKNESKDQLRLMYLSGTVSVPPRLPDVAEISFTIIGKKEVVVATEKPSPKLVIKRTFFLTDVASVFVPQDSEAVNLRQGEWLEDKVLAAKSEDLLDKKPIKGIVFVRENAPSMLELQAGLTAAESAEYYPPLPDDRSVNHYDMDGHQSLYDRVGKPGCGYHG